MLKKSILVTFGLLLLGPAWSALAGFDPSLAVYWPLDEGTGNVATDASGHGVNGTISAGPTWVKPGQIGNGALRFTGTGDVRGAHVALDKRSFTIAFWINPTLPATNYIVFSEVQTGSTDLSMHFRIGGPSPSNVPVNGIRFGFYSDDVDSPANVLTSNTWYHLTFWYDSPTKTQKIYINGVQVATRTATSDFQATTGSICLGSWTGSEYFTGLVDDFQLWQKALSPGEIKSSMAGLSNKALAVNVSPADGATDVPRDATLSWTAGQFAAAHDVYLGTVFTDVNTASRTDAKSVLAKQGQTETTYDPAGVFAYGQTYYWRVDEVNKPADNTIFKGGVWSFTAEPYGYPVTPAKATASSFQPGMGPEKTIDGSGLDKSDLHGSEPTTMWMSAGVKPNWIQYEFDKPYKLYQLLVWNSNQLIEGFLGFGAKKVTIETSVDGTTWTPLANVPEFAKAPGIPGYAANTTVNFGGVEAKFVKLTIEANWGGLAPQAGLAEVRFSYIPVQARSPQPATGTAAVGLDAKLDWRPGREAVSHRVLFGTDRLAVIGGTAPAKTVTEHGFDPGTLNFGTSYYWRVDEVNAVTYPGSVWSFTTQEFGAIDDFESYTDKAGEEVFTAWVDGVTDGRSNSVVGLNTAVNGTFCDMVNFHGGKMSMPFEYNNVKTPFYSQAERTFDKAQDWTTNGATHLGLWVRGAPVSFLQAANGDMTVSAQGADIYNTTDQFRYIYQQLTGDGSITVRLDSLIVTNAWAKAGVMIRETLTPAAKSVHMIVSGSNGFEFQYRPTAGANTVGGNTTGGTPALPQWVRLTRKGNTFTGEYSSDGKTWNKVVSTAVNDPQDVLMNNTVYIGIPVTSHVTGTTTVAQFSNISTTGNVTGAWQMADVGVAHGGNGPGDLYLTVKDSAGKAATVSYPGGANVNGWTLWKIPMSDLTAAGVKMTSIKKMAISVGDPAKPTAGGAGKINIDDIGFGGRPAPVGLVASYSFENDLKDGSANGYDGTAVGAPTFTPGKTGSALTLNGTTDCVDLGVWPAFNFPGSFSLSVWANIGAWTSNWNHVMVGNRGENGIGWQLRRRDSNKFCFTTRGIGQDDLGSTMNAPLGEWVHIAAVYDNAANTKRIYVNGVQDAFAATNPGKLAATTHNTYIGARANSGNTGVEGRFTGMLDEVKIYDIALTPEEVLKLAGK